MFQELLARINETCIPHFNTETKSQFKEWRKPEEIRKPQLKTRSVPSVSKVVITVF